MLYSGLITFDGKPVRGPVLDDVGYLPEERGLYRKSKLLGTILYFASLKKVPPHEARSRAHSWLGRFDLLAYHDRKIEELSKGNQQKVQFIIAILHDPDLVILDEPFSGLDPVNQILLKDILMELKQKGKAIVFSTHQMEQAEKLCDTICLINHGRVVLDGKLREVKSAYGSNTVRIEFNGDGSFLGSLAGVKKAMLYENYAEIILDGMDSVSSLLGEISRRLDLRKFELAEPSLTAIFLSLVSGSAPTAQEAPR